MSGRARPTWFAHKYRQERNTTLMFVLLTPTLRLPGYVIFPAAFVAMLVMSRLALYFLCGGKNEPFVGIASLCSTPS